MSQEWDIELNGAVVRRSALVPEEWLKQRLGQEWIRTTEGVKPADLQSAPLHRRIRF